MTESESPHVELRLPADGAYVTILRTATAGLAARIDFTLDDIEDLRIAVDEACAMVLPQAMVGSSLDCAFWLEDNGITVSVSARCRSPKEPSRDGFAWTVLTALASSVAADVDGDRLSITLTRKAGRRP
jgi:serine/threonine-protein kinase RsbW